MTTLPFRQVDVFSTEPLLGNPVAVVHDADDLTTAQMAAFARWTNLSETTFLVAPTEAGADYRLRIFTPGAELPFAGHPTLGSAHAWLEAGGVPQRAGRVVQQCGAGLVVVHRDDERLSFEAPPLVRSGPVDDATREHVLAGLRLDPTGGQVVALAWVDNGPGWVGVLLADADAVLAVEPDWPALAGLEVGVVGPYPPGSPEAVEVRAFCPDLGLREDPVTGSLNAGLAQWLAGDVLPSRYVASQGRALGRRGRVHVAREGDVVLVGGATRTTVAGTVSL